MKVRIAKKGLRLTYISFHKDMGLQSRSSLSGYNFHQYLLASWISAAEYLFYEDQKTGEQGNGLNLPVLRFY
jgi:hypothetical protein